MDSVGDTSNRAQGWILWISLGIKCTDGLISLLPAAFEHFTDALEPHRRNYMPIGEYYSHETETEVRLIPTPRVLYGFWSALSLVQYWPGWFLARIRRARASDLGQHFLVSFSEECWASSDKTDHNIYQSYQKLIDDETCQSTRSRWNWSYPVSGLGKIAQFLFAWIHPGNNIINGGVAEAGAQR